MAKSLSVSTEKTVRDSKSGRFVTVRGVGALQSLKIKKNVDLTKPIASQAMKGTKRRIGASPSVKH